ncbi:matrix extracellular phosphoglycoprotein isoform X1 [Lepus europaeus]|uniref:matrix extracellular phosphoglycoprotein isoform X1 n=2 Tax=Lepus europaeus TaxID=9983 RepID=UPI002B4701F1|nr:matrix extracellular phosphoglycoprotein isoform X1 [Lepus europaeus]
MLVIYIGLLLLGVSWAAPTFRPQTKETQRGCVEEQRMTYKGHHEKHGHYIFKCVYTLPGKKNQTNVKEEEKKDKENAALDHFDKRRNQQPSPKDTVQERDLALLETIGKDRSVKSQTPSANRQTLNEDLSVITTGVHNDLAMSIYPEPTGDRGVEDGDDTTGKFHDQEEYSTGLIGKNTQHTMGPVMVTGALGEENRKSKLRNVVRNIPEGIHYAKIHSKEKRSHQRDSQVQSSPIKSKSIRHIQHNADYLKQLPKVKKVSRDFEGSGYTDLQGRGDNDITPFSGDGQPSKDIPRKGGVIGPDPGGIDVQTGFSGPRKAEAIDPDTKGPGYNEIPEIEENGGNAFGTRDQTAKEATDVSLAEGSNDIIGSTNFKKLPGKEGNRVDADSQNAHQGKVEFHFPQAPSKEKGKEGSRDATPSTNYNEIPKNGKGSSRKGTGHSDRNQVKAHESQRFSAKGKSQDLLSPSHGLDNEMKNEIGSHGGPNNKGNTITHSRKNHYVPHPQDNEAWNNGVPQRKGSWGYRRSHSNRSFRLRKKDDSSESSDSGSSSESDGD